MDIKAQDVKTLRDKTGIGIMKCKAALMDAGGDIEKAIEILRKKGLAEAQKRAHRATEAGSVASYIHTGGRVGVLVEVNCETDFVAKTEDFQNLVKEVLLQIASMSPLYVSSDEIPEDVIEKEKEIYRAQLAETGKPEKIIEKIVEGKMAKFFAQVCLLDQPSVRESKQTVQDMVNQVIAKTGENIGIRRFVRYALGEDL